MPRNVLTKISPISTRLPIVNRVNNNHMISVILLAKDDKA